MMVLPLNKTQSQMMIWRQNYLAALIPAPSAPAPQAEATPQSEDTSSDEDGPAIAPGSFG